MQTRNAMCSKIYAAIGDDGLSYLASLPSDELLSLVGEHAMRAHSARVDNLRAACRATGVDFDAVWELGSLVR